MNPSGSDLAHDHEWCPEPTVDFDEDVFITFGCDWAEVTSATTSERHDETFYGYGAECAATKTAVYEIVAERRSDGREIVSEDYEDFPMVFEEIDCNHADAIAEAAERNVFARDQPDRFHATDVVVDGVAWKVYLELDKTRVEEDWC